MKNLAMVFMALGMLFMFQPAANAITTSTFSFEVIDNNDGDPEKCKKCDKCKEGKCDAECKAKCEKGGKCEHKDGATCSHKEGESKCASKCSTSGEHKSCCKKTEERK